MNAHLLQVAPMRLLYSELLEDDQWGVLDDHTLLMSVALYQKVMVPFVKTRNIVLLVDLLSRYQRIPLDGFRQAAEA